MNKVILIGRLGADPEARQSKKGNAVTSFSVATNETWKGKDGEKHENTEWHKVVCFNRTAETCAKYLSKGRQVCVEGKIQTQEWKDDDDNTRYTTQIVANNVEFLSGGDAGSGGGSKSQPLDQEFDDADIPF